MVQRLRLTTEKAAAAKRRRNQREWLRELKEEKAARKAKETNG
jgi:hypothetical protein